jgi:hypothetical protein
MSCDDTAGRKEYELRCDETAGQSDDTAGRKEYELRCDETAGQSDDTAGQTVTQWRHQFALDCSHTHGPGAYCYEALGHSGTRP